MTFTWTNILTEEQNLIGYFAFKMHIQKECTSLKTQTRAKNPQFQPQIPMADTNLHLKEAAHAVDQEMHQHSLSMDRKMKEWKETNKP